MPAPTAPVIVSPVGPTIAGIVLVECSESTIPLQPRVAGGAFDLPMLAVAGAAAGPAPAEDYSLADDFAGPDGALVTSRANTLNGGAGEGAWVQTSVAAAKIVNNRYYADFSTSEIRSAAMQAPNGILRAKFRRMGLAFGGEVSIKARWDGTANNFYDLRFNTAGPYWGIRKTVGGAFDTAGAADRPDTWPAGEDRTVEFELTPTQLIARIYGHDGVTLIGTITSNDTSLKPAAGYVGIELSSTDVNGAHCDQATYTPTPETVVVASDVSDEANGTLLHAVVPETGAAWFKHADSQADAQITGGAIHAATLSALYGLSPALPSRDSYVEADVTWAGGFAEVAIALGMQGSATGTQSRYEARFALGDSQVYVRWVTAGGGGGQLAAASGIVFANPSTHTLRLERRMVSGNPMLRVLLDGVEIIAPTLQNNGDEDTMTQVGHAAIHTAAASAAGVKIIRIKAGAL